MTKINQTAFLMLIALVAFPLDFCSAMESDSDAGDGDVVVYPPINNPMANRQEPNIFEHMLPTEHLETLKVAAQKGNLYAVEKILAIKPELVNAVFYSGRSRRHKTESLFATAICRYYWEMALLIVQSPSFNPTWENPYGDDYLQIILYHLDYAPRQGENREVVLHTIKTMVKKLLKKLPDEKLRNAYYKLKTNGTFTIRIEGDRGYIGFYQNGYKHLFYGIRQCIWPNYCAEITAMIELEQQERKALLS